MQHSGEYEPGGSFQESTNICNCFDYFVRTDCGTENPVSRTKDDSDDLLYNIEVEIVTAKSKILEDSNNLRCPQTCVPEFGASTKPAPSVGLNPKSNIDESDRNRGKTADTILSVPTQTSGTSTKIRTEKPVQSFPGSHDLPWSGDHTIYRVPNSKLFTRDHTTCRLQTELAAQSFKHERVCLHSPESTQRVW